MEREKMIKISWKPYSTVLYKTNGMDFSVECLLLAIDFENEIVTLQPLNTDFWVKEDFITNLKYVELPAKTMKVVK